MKRLGFVKLSRYGLLLTPEGRIMSLRPAVLDDGLGGRIVGWKDGDLAAMELGPWEPARPAGNAAVATRVAVTPSLARSPRATPAPLSPPAGPALAAPVAVVPAVAAPAAVPVVVSQAPEVAAAAPVEEDEWAWEIALARVRAAESEMVARAVTPAARRRADTLPPPVGRTEPMPAVSPPRVGSPVERHAWPTAETLAPIDYEDHTSPAREIARIARVPDRPIDRPIAPPLASPIGVRRQATALLPVVPRLPAAASPPATPATPAVRTLPRASSPVTVIPIPKLPSLAASGRTTQMQPVVRPAARAMPTPIPPVSPRRFPRGTGPVLPPGVEAKVPPVHPAAAEPTLPNLDDATSPGLLLPAVARTALPSIKQRMAR